MIYHPLRCCRQTAAHGKHCRRKCIGQTIVSHLFHYHNAADTAANVLPLVLIKYIPYDFYWVDTNMVINIELFLLSCQSTSNANVTWHDIVACLLVFILVHRQIIAIKIFFWVVPKIWILCKIVRTCHAKECPFLEWSPVACIECQCGIIPNRKTCKIPNSSRYHNGTQPRLSGNAWMQRW